MKRKWTVGDLITRLEKEDRWAQVVLCDADTNWTITDFDIDIDFDLDNKARIIILPSDFSDMEE